ncbi:MAG: PCMD domain-containing protein [Candidatus Cryptobacteroides sp.]
MKIKPLILSLLLCAASCIKNDIPYPVVVAEISSLEAEGAKSVSIDKSARKVTISLEEQTDIRSVKILSVGYSDPSVVPSWDIRGTRDLSSPLKVTLTTFDDYEWTVVAEQTIERYFTLSSQVGESVIDPANRRVMLEVDAGADLENLSVTSCKLGPSDITAYSPEPSTLKDFSSVQPLLVVYGEYKEIWNIYVSRSEVTVKLSVCDPWANKIYLRAQAAEGPARGFRYRREGEQDWVEVQDVSYSSGEFSAWASGLESNTAYECVAYSGKDTTEPVRVTTESEIQLPNSGFETYSHAESDKYYSFYDPSSPELSLQTKWWGSGNKGSTTVGSSYTITMPCTDDKVEGESSLLMASAYVIVKFAAGNIFSGEYYKTIGTSGGVIRLGRPFESRPAKLVLSLKYKAGIITDKTFSGAPEGDPVKVGDRDRGCVWVALGTWDYKRYGGSPDSPYELNTTDKSTFFDPEGEDVIAYGRFIADRDYDSWTRIEIPLDYRTLTKRPTHIIVSAASSMLGDYFTGSAESKMWIDDVRLEY